MLIDKSVVKSHMLAIGLVAALSYTAIPARAQEGVKVGNFPSGPLSIIIPSGPGGGLDSTSRAVQAVLRDEKIAAKAIDVVNVPGGGGVTGLAQFVSRHSGDGNTVLSISLATAGAAIMNKAPVRLNQVTPLVRLTAEYNAVVVGPKSKFTSLQQLLDAFKKDPSSLVWTGGPGGGPDHTTLGLLATRIGVPPEKLRYTAFSGGEARAMIMGDQMDAAVVSLGEINADSKAGLVRILAVTAPERIPGMDYPTLRELGVDMEFSSWRGIVGPPDMPADAKEGWIKMLTAMHESEAWKKILKDRNLTDGFLVGDAFADYVNAEDQRIAELFQKLGLIK